MGFTFAEDRKRARERRAARKAEGLAQKFKNWVAGPAPEPKSEPVQEYQVRIFRAPKIIETSEVVVFTGNRYSPSIIERDIAKEGWPVVAEKPLGHEFPTVPRKFRQHLAEWAARINHFSRTRS